MQHLKVFLENTCGKNLLTKKIEWRKLNSWPRVKVDRPTIVEFYANHIDKAMTLWYSNQNPRMHQQQRKAYKKRKIKHTETESLNFNLTLIFEDSDSGSDNSNSDFG